MELFSEIYSCYYQVLRHLLLAPGALTQQDIRSLICTEGFEESLLSIIPRLEGGSWNLFKKDGTLYRSRISSSFTTPVSALEKSYLKALLSDARIGLFLEPAQLDELRDMLTDVSPLWKPEQFYCFDRFSGGDPYEDEDYRHIFRTLLKAQRQNRYVDIDYTSPKGTRLHHHYIPARLEYSVKNDKFRLLALKPASSFAPRSRRKRTAYVKKNPDYKLEILNVSRIQSACLLEKTYSAPVDLNAMIRRTYYREPLKLRIVDKRNALERAMLHFANYEKNTTKIDEDTYECLIYYNQGMETELLIEVMSFGPMITVLGSDGFLGSLRERLLKQVKICDHP